VHTLTECRLQYVNDFDMSCISNLKTPTFYRARGGWIAFLMSSECCEKKIEYKPAASNIKNLGPTVYMVLFSRVRKMM